MKNLEKKQVGVNLGHAAAFDAATSRRKSQVHFYVSSDLYKKLKRIGINRELSIGEMFNEMLTKYLNENKDY